MRGLRFIETYRARALRRDAPNAERAVWRIMRNRGLGGFKFVRQEPIGPYFADFACREAKLVVEIDGATHSTAEELTRDARRSAFLAKNGYRVLRFTNEQVFENIEAVGEAILAELQRGAAPHPSTP
jgi:very-short-patch-repair endonuclease